LEEEEQEENKNENNINNNNNNVGIVRNVFSGSQQNSYPNSSPIKQQLQQAQISNKPRTMIQKLILENFKSYSGKKEISPFHHNFSAVVGPNGSGKSNVIESLLFVFGKRAKELRHKTVSELIHNSKTKDPLDYCKVTVCFQDIIDKPNGEYDVVPNSAIEVSRTGKRDNTTTYSLDGKKVPFTQVEKMLQTKGINLNNNRFLILQGEVQQIATMKPKGNGKEEGILEYLEEIIGTNVYVESILENEKKNWKKPMT